MMIGGCNHLEKYESQWEGLSHILWKIKMFQTTNQMMIGIPVKRTSADSAQWLCVGRRQVGKCLPGEIWDKSQHLGLGQSFKTSGPQILIYYILVSTSYWGTQFWPIPICLERAWPGTKNIGKCTNSLINGAEFQAKAPISHHIFRRVVRHFP